MLKRRLHVIDTSSRRQKLDQESDQYLFENSLDRQKICNELTMSPDSTAYSTCICDEEGIETVISDRYVDTIGELVDEKDVDIMICEESCGTYKENRSKISITDYFAKKETPSKARVKPLQQSVDNPWSGYKKQTAILEYIQHNANCMDTIEEIECGDDFCRSCNIRFSCDENCLMRCTFCNKLCCSPFTTNNNSCIKSCDNCNEYYCKYCSTSNYDLHHDRLLCLDCNNN